MPPSALAGARARFNSPPTTKGTALNRVDYTGVTNTLIFAAGEKVQTFTVPILNDGLKEASKYFRVTVSNPTNQVFGSQRTATITISDNDPGVQFAMNQPSVHESEGTILLTVTRGSDGLLGAFNVDYATTNFTAVAGQDYADTHGTLEFAVGEMTKSIAVSVLDEGVAERDEVFRVGPSNPTGGMALGAAASVTATVTVCDTTEMRPHRFSSIGVSPANQKPITKIATTAPISPAKASFVPIRVRSGAADGATSSRPKSRR